jgi:hypothetical protein
MKVKNLKFNKMKYYNIIYIEQFISVFLFSIPMLSQKITTKESGRLEKHCGLPLLRQLGIAHVWKTDADAVLGCYMRNVKMISGRNELY